MQIEIGDHIRHKNGNVYRVLMLTNTKTERPEQYPVTVIYRNIENGTVWSRPLDDMDRSFVIANDDSHPYLEALGTLQDSMQELKARVRHAEAAAELAEEMYKATLFDLDTMKQQRNRAFQIINDAVPILEFARGGIDGPEHVLLSIERFSADLGGEQAGDG